MPSDPEKTRSKKAQVALDLLSSYGVAIIIMLIAIAVAYKASTGAAYVFSSQCTPSPGFSCGYYALSQNGILTIGISQATGGGIVVSGVACSTSIASSGLPAYSNVYVTNSLTYYPPPSNSPLGGVIIPSSGTATFNVYCYGPTGIATSYNPGGSFVGYLWLNYTVQNTNIKTTQQIASLELQYI